MLREESCGGEVGLKNGAPTTKTNKQKNPEPLIILHCFTSELRKCSPSRPQW